MGYTHYWTQRRDFTGDEWRDVSGHVGTITRLVECELGVPLASGTGEPGTRPAFSPGAVALNGVGGDSHETFAVDRRRARLNPYSRVGWNSCKTARKPYDVAVTAVLAYLATVAETHDVSSDGRGEDWLAGVDAARRALPRFANVLDVPRPVLESDRWCDPWVSVRGRRYRVHFCVDGRGYVVRESDGESRRFATHAALARFLDRTKLARFRSGGRTSVGCYDRDEPDIWNATGSFDQRRLSRIALAQNRALATLFPVDPADRACPPLYTRPGEFPPPARRAYHFSELLEGVDR